jgi:hypothetical protein
MMAVCATHFFNQSFGSLDVVSNERYESLAGHRFLDGDFVLQKHESWLWNDCVLAPGGPATAHPSVAYMIAMRGGGASISDIFELLEVDEDSGVMFGEIAFEFAEAVKPDVRYRVEGEINSVERKQGRRAGPFDRVTFVHRLRDTGRDCTVSTLTHVWIFPR